MGDRGILLVVQVGKQVPDPLLKRPWGANGSPCPHRNLIGGLIGRRLVASVRSARA
jgi:hypothetical protein